MNEKIQIFRNEEFGSVRTVMIENQPWFVGKDVASALGYSNPTKAIRDHVDADDRWGSDSDPHVFKDKFGREQIPTLINESGLYSLILSSKLPSAKKFKRWVTSEVLPSIRKYGAYISDETLEELENSKEAIADLLAKLKNEQASRKKMKLEFNKILEAQAKVISDMKPKAAYCDSVLKGERLMNVTQISKDYGMSATCFNTILRAYDVQYKVSEEELWVLKAKYQDKGYTQTQMIRLKHSDRFKQYTFWTEKGREFLYHFLKEKGIVPVGERITEEE